MEAGIKSRANCPWPISGVSAKATIWITNRLRKVNGRPMKSDTQPQNRRPTPLKMDIVTTRAEAVVSATPVKSCASGAATEINAAPAVTFNARMSHSTYHLGLLKDSPNVYSRTELTACSFTEGVQPGGA